MILTRHFSNMLKVQYILEFQYNLSFCSVDRLFQREFSKMSHLGLQVNVSEITAANSKF